MVLWDLALASIRDGTYWGTKSGSGHGAGVLGYGIFIWRVTCCQSDAWSNGISHIGHLTPILTHWPALKCVGVERMFI